MTAANTRVSNLVSSQMPFFVKNDHPAFIEFVQAYYEWMEQSGNTLDVTKNIGKYFDADTAVDQFMGELEKTFIPTIPKDALVDRALLIKHVKDFYRSRGTEKSITFLLRILFGADAGNTSFYYPKSDILRASDGKWFVEKSLKFVDVYIDDVLTRDIQQIQKAFRGTKITGSQSLATAIVERVDSSYEGIVIINEMKLSQQSKDFFSGEQISTIFFDDSGQQHTIRTTILSGILNKVNVVSGGSGYTIGTNVPVESNTGNGAVVQIGSVSTGSIVAVYALDGGAGYQANNYMLFSSTTANAYVQTVKADGKYHPNTYNIVSSIIALEANTAIGNAVYSNLNPSLVDPANSSIANSMSYFVYGNTGPVSVIAVVDGGSGITVLPNVSVIANSRIKELGILGRMNVISGGVNYQIGDTIVFNNVPFGYGTGASANVTNVAANGMITEVKFVEVPGFPVGGMGYEQERLPFTNIVSANGTGANVVVTALLGHGGTFKPISDSIGAIKTFKIVFSGSDYQTPPTINLTAFGDGTAQANSSILYSGVYTYPGRYLNDDGHLSSYNFLQDRDYYQDFSYVVKISQSIDKYRKYLKQLIHPSGMKLFGEYTFNDTNVGNSSFISVNTNNSILVYASYNATANANGTTVRVTTSRNVSNINTASIEFVSGNLVGVLANNIYSVTANGTNDYLFVSANTKVNGTGTVITSI